MNPILTTDFKDMTLLGRGKVRDIYDLGDKLLIISTDRLSAFDVVMPNGINDKGAVLTELSAFWFNQTKHIIKNHMITVNVDEMPEVCLKHKDILHGRSMLVYKAKPIMAECVIRGYITGSGLKEYNKTGKICGIELPKGLKESDKLDHPLFTPSTKAEVGHDESIDYQSLEKTVGADVAKKLKDYTTKIYNFAAEYALKKGIIIADTKLEFGTLNGEIILIDEAITPDSSRFWYADKYKPGQTQDSMDKQVVRNYLETLDWDKTPPAPVLPDNIVKEARKRYREIADRLIK